MNEDNSFRLIFNESMQEHIFSLAEVRGRLMVTTEMYVNAYDRSESGVQDVIY